jgi:hypothetical protein
MRVLPAVLLATILIATNLGAQDILKFRLVGTIRDADSGAGIPTAIVRFPDLRLVAVADSSGRFVFEKFPVGMYKVEIGRIGYVSIIGAITVDTSSQINAGLIPQPILLEGIVAVASRLESRRRAVPYSVLSYRSEMLATATGSLSDFLQLKNGSLVDCQGAGGITKCVFSRGKELGITLFVDENRIPDGGDMLDMYFPDEFAEVEFYPSLGMVRAYTPAFLQLVAKKQARIDNFILTPQGLLR